MPPHRNNLTGTLAGGAVMQLQLDADLRLGNKGDALLLMDASGGTIDQVTYEGRMVRPGRTICFWPLGWPSSPTSSRTRAASPLLRPRRRLSVPGVETPRTA